MGAAGHVLRVLRLVLLGGALAVLWMLFTAAGSSAAAAQGDRSLPGLVEAPMVREVLGAPHHDASVAEVEAESAETRNTLLRSPVRQIVKPVERVVSDTAAVVDTTRRDAEQLSAPVVERTVDPVVDVVETVADEVDVVHQSGEVFDPPTPPAADTAPPAVAVATSDALTATGTPGAARSAGVDQVTLSAAPAEPLQAAAAAPWSMVVQETSATVTSSQRAVRGPDRSSPPTMPLPMAPASSGCVPGAASGGSSPNDHAGDRTSVFAWVPAEAPTWAAGPVSFAAGPSALPGFSPE